jgi:uncharacterized small protein (DUF1192 family)
MKKTAKKTVKTKPRQNRLDELAAKAPPREKVRRDTLINALNDYCELGSRIDLLNKQIENLNAMRANKAELIVTLAGRGKITHNNHTYVPAMHGETVVLRRLTNEDGLILG